MLFADKAWNGSLPGAKLW